MVLWEEKGGGGVKMVFRIVCSVTYYELIPTAPVKYYCKTLTVISLAEQIVTFEFLLNLFASPGGNTTLPPNPFPSHYLFKPPIFQKKKKSTFHFTLPSGIFVPFFLLKKKNFAFINILKKLIAQVSFQFFFNICILFVFY